MKKRVLFFGMVVVFLALSLIGVTQLFSQSETILAKVGDQVITQSDLDEFLKKFAQFKGGKPFTLEEKKIMLNNLAKALLINMESEREKLDQKPEIKTKLKLYRMEVLNEEYVNTKVKPYIIVTEEEIAEKLKENPNLVPKESLILKEILVKTLAEANEIYETLKKGENSKREEKFSEIAAKKSLAPSKIHGGLIGQKMPISRGQLPKPLEEVAFKLKKGDLSKPIKTDEGYYILFLVDRKEKTPEEINKLEAAIKDRIRQIEISRKTQTEMEKRAEEIKKSTKVEVYPDRIKKE